MPSAAAVQQVWITTLAVYAVVLLVVAGLLMLILGTARRINDGVRQIWNVGQKVANNTIQIALLLRTNHLASSILESAGRTAGAVGALERHAAACPGCPACVIGPSGAGGSV